MAPQRRVLLIRASDAESDLILISGVINSLTGYRAWDTVHAPHAGRTCRQEPDAAVLNDHTPGAPQREQSEAGNAHIGGEPNTMTGSLSR